MAKNLDEYQIFRTFKKLDDKTVKVRWRDGKTYRGAYERDLLNEGYKNRELDDLIKVDILAYTQIRPEPGSQTIYGVYLYLKQPMRYQGFTGKIRVIFDKIMRRNQ